MSKDPLIAHSIDDLANTVASESCLLPVGNQTKTPLSAVPGCRLVSLQRLSGLIEYEPSEFTFTAWAGSKVAEIEAELSQRGQYLPFDPVMAKVGATLGGTLASGLSGPGRFRYGGVRDFCIGVHWMDGQGRLVRGGGKVVKNAAGFDFPKFMVGSMGRFGILVDMTFKVFPKPKKSLTWCSPFQDHQSAMNALAEVASSRLEVDALDYRPNRKELAIRLSGPEEVLPLLMNEISGRWAQGRELSDEEALAYWEQVKDLTWSGFEQPLIVKVPLNLTKFLAMEASLSKNDACRLHLSVGGNLAWIALESREHLAWLSDQLESHELPGLVVADQRHAQREMDSDEVFGMNRCQIGRWPEFKMLQAVKHAMDPLAKFPGV